MYIYVLDMYILYLVNTNLRWYSQPGTDLDEMVLIKMVQDFLW